MKITGRNVLIIAVLYSMMLLAGPNLLKFIGLKEKMVYFFPLVWFFILAFLSIIFLKNLYFYKREGLIEIMKQEIKNFIIAVLICLFLTSVSIKLYF